MHRGLLGFALSMVLVAGCSGGSVDETEATSSQRLSTTSPRATSDVTTATSVTPPSSSTVSSEPEESDLESPLVYVVMGDSGAFTPPEPDGLMWQYAERLERHFGVEVEIRNHAEGSIHSATMLDRLQNDDELRADLADADVVTTDIPIAVWIEPLMTVGGVGGRDPADCGGDDGQQCLRDALEQYKEDTDAIIDELIGITQDDALIRLYDVYMINTGYKLETGTLDISNPNWKAGMDHVEESAARYGIPVAQVYDAFMGPDGTDDPYVKGLLDDDQLHPNADGAALMADLLDDLGY
jgi:hypothetical protein